MVKLKFSYLESFEEIWEEALETTQTIITRGRRSRFLSEDVNDTMQFSGRERRGTFTKESFPNLSHNLSDLSSSFRKNSKPFKVQNDVVGENFLNSLILSSKGSNESLSKKYRKGKLFIAKNRIPMPQLR